jgi:signal transduction histidine kinase
MVDYPDGRILIPIEHELQERLAWFISLRWLTSGGILLGAFAARWIVPGNISLIPLYSIGLAVFIYNIPFHFYFFQAERLSKPIGKNFIYLQIGLDWLALIFVVHYTGGIQSPVILAFTAHLIIGAILLRTRTCYMLAIVASFLIGVLSMLEILKIWPLSESSKFFADPLHGINSPLNLWIATSVFFIIIANLATSITQRLREKEVTLFNSARALDRAYREMEALYKISQVINSTLEMKEVLSLIAENAAKLMSMKACFIRLFDRSGKKLYIGGAYGLGQAYINTRPRDFDKSPIDKETIARGVVQVLEVGDETRFEYREDARREGLRSVLCVPIASKNRVLGVIRVYSSEPHHFSEQEQNLLKNFANLGALAIDNARSYAEIKTLSEERVWFTRMTHHHLRAPLAVMQSILDALPYAGTLTEKQKELLSRVSKRIYDALDLIRDLLDLAGAQRFIEGEAEKVFIGQAIEKTLELARERARSKNIEMEVSIPSPDVAIQVQASDIERIFTNFLDNAIKYTASGGRVSLTITADESAVRAEVADTGIGIDPRDHARIFEGFYRTPAAKATNEMGTGLGLSIVRRLLDRCNGKLELHSAVGQGSRFIITFPLYD